MYGAKDFVILRKFSIVLLTSNADDWLSNRMRSYWAIIDHVWIEWLNLETEFGQNFWGWVEKIQIFQLTFCVGAVRRLPLIFILTLPRPHSSFCSHLDFTKKVWIYPSCGLLQASFCVFSSSLNQLCVLVFLAQWIMLLFLKFWDSVSVLMYFSLCS